MSSAQPLECPGGSETKAASNARSDDLLRELLIELALTLLPRGMTPKTFGELSRYAFAHAAAKVSQRSNGTINHSRVAAITGLSRADVKRLLWGDSAPASPKRSGQMPIERVLDGWRADRRFLDKQGNPKPLRIVGLTNSFVVLARLYGGDVPHKAILDELQRAGVVRREGKTVTLTMRGRRRRSSLVSLRSVLPAVIDGIRVASSAEASQTTPSLYRLTLPAQTPLDMAVTRERCLTTVTAMLNALGESLGGALEPAPRVIRRQAHSFVVTVLLAENRRTGSLRLSTQRKLSDIPRVPKKARRSSNTSTKEQA